MKRLEYLAVNYAKRFTKAWDYFCCASDAYLNGYKQGREDASSFSKSIEKFDESGEPYELPNCVNGTARHISKKLKELGNDEVQIKLDDGEQQLSVATFQKWKQEKSKLSFKESLKTQLPHLDFTDLRVLEEGDIITFQGIARRVE